MASIVGILTDKRGNVLPQVTVIARISSNPAGDTAQDVTDNNGIYDIAVANAATKYYLYTNSEDGGFNGPNFSGIAMSSGSAAASFTLISDSDWLTEHYGSGGNQAEHKDINVDTLTLRANGYIETTSGFHDLKIASSSARLRIDSTTDALVFFFDTQVGSGDDNRHLGLKEAAHDSSDRFFYLGVLKNYHLKTDGSFILGAGTFNGAVTASAAWTVSNAWNVNEVMTFLNTKIPKLSSYTAPTLSTELAPKQYVDDEVLGVVSGWTDDGTTVRLTTATDKVRIGYTEAAKAYLHVGPATRSYSPISGTEFIIEATSGLNGYYQILVDATKQGGWYVGTTSAQNDGSIIYTTDDQEWRFFTNNVERFRISNTAVKCWQPLEVASGTTVNEFSIDGTLAGDSDDALPTEKAVKTYVDTEVSKIEEKIFDADNVNLTNTADWAVNSAAGTAADSNNSGLGDVLLFDDTTEEGFCVKILPPSNAVNIVFTPVSRAETAPGAAKQIVLKLYNRGIKDNVTVESWSAGTELTAIDIPTNEYWQQDSQSIALSTLGITAGELTQLQLTRNPAAASDDLVGDLSVVKVGISFT
jgi:hypothetical protein